jgi:alpha-amylase
MSQAKSVIAYVFFADGIPTIYSGQEQHYAGASDPYNREAIWLSGYATNSELYKFITTANQIRKLAISKDSSYLTTRVCTQPGYYSCDTLMTCYRITLSTPIAIQLQCGKALVATK